MKISLNSHSLNFKGYDAQKIKSLYMQNAKAPEQRSIYKELYAVGKKEGFDVFVQNNDKIISSPEQLHDCDICRSNFWSQDNKMLVKTNGEEKIIYPKLFYGDENTEPVELAKNINLPSKESELVIEGGNIFLGKNQKGENYLLVGENTLNASAIYQFLKNSNVKNLNDNKLRTFMEYGKIYTSVPIFSKQISLLQYNENSQYWKECAKDIFCEEFDVKHENLYFVSQPNFHLDLGLRPLEYPFVLVNDDKLVNKNLKELEEKFNCDDNLLKKFKQIQKYVAKRYKNSEEIKKELSAQGFVPIPVSGAIGTYNVNFTNALVNKRQDGMSYITNSVECADKRYEFLQNKFEEDVAKQYPQIDRFYYISGKINKKDENNIMKYLRELHGGIHCLCMEEPEI